MKKKREIFSPFGDETRLRIRKMKLTVLMTFLVLASFGNSFSQVTLSLQFNKANIYDVLGSIEKKTDYVFLYKDEVLNGSKEITVDFKEAKFEEVLKTICKQCNIDYEVHDRQILLKEKMNVPTPPEQQQPQTRSISGKITDAKGATLPGVSVVVKGTTIGVITDLNGNYSLSNVPQNATLQFSFVGMKPQEVVMTGNKTTFNITLQDEVFGVEEVVVVGYGVQKKVTLTGAVSAIKSENLITTKSNNVQNLLSGKIAGVQVTQKTSEPGRFDNDFQIRGMGAPLVVVDGVPRDNFNKLDANEIESISVLKDGSAAIYGVRAANGVVLITTKRGAKGSAFRLEYSGYVGFQNMINQPQPLDAIGFMQLQNEKAFNGGSNTPTYPQSSFDPYLNGTKISTNWEGNTIRRQASQTQHSFSATGGTDKITYFVNFGYSKQNGFWKSNDLSYNRLSLRSNVSAEVAKGLRIEVLLNTMSDTKNQPSSWPTWNLFKGYWTQIPLNPYYANDNPAYPFFAADGLHPDYMTDASKSGYQKSNQRLIQTNMSMEWTIPWINGLKAKGMYSYDYRQNENKNFRKTFDLYTYNDATKIYTAAAVNSPSRLTRQYYGYITSQLQISLAYNKLFNKVHNVTGLLLYEENDRYGDNFYAQRDYSMDAVDQLFAGNSTNQVGNMGTGDLFHYANKALVGRFNYDFATKYIAEFSFRYDGSSMFQKGNQWGFFPSGSIGWRMSQEAFIKNSEAAKLITDLKLRASYGLMGDDRASSYQFLSGYNYPSNGYVFGGNYTNAFGMRGMPNPNITWFKAAVLNIGVDADFWKGLLGVNFDIFQRKRTDLLATRSESLPGLVGANLPQENLEADRTQGWELTLSHRNKIGNDFKYNVSGNIAMNRTRWVYREISKQGNSYLNWRNNTNNRWNDIWWGYDNTGRFQSTKEIFSGPIYSTSKGNSMMLPGDLVFGDWNGDGIIDNNDVHPIGYNTAINKTNYNGGMPMVNYGFTLGAEYKGFDLNMVFQGTAMSWIRYPEQLEMPLPWNRNGLTMFLDRWHRADQFDPNSAWVPGYFPSTFRDNGRNDFITSPQSTFWMQDASYLRLKSLEIGYTIPEKTSKYIGIQKIRVFLNAYNLFTITGLKYCDPEHTGDEYAYTYPLSQAFNIGINVSF
jgi:TonB-linked SusC/RagA family outer membrane protein